MTELREFLSNIVLVITATTLFYVAINDLREFKIRNEMIVTLACLYGIYAFVSGQWIHAHWNLALAAFMFAFFLIFYARNWLGGGDVKILTIGFLWTGNRYALPFAVLLLAIAIIHVGAARLGLVGARYVNGRAQIAYAPSVCGALIGVFVLRWSGF